MDSGDQPSPDPPEDDVRRVAVATRVVLAAIVAGAFVITFLALIMA
jgi:hypothetical protein